MKLTSYTFTRKEMEEHLRELAKNLLPDYLKGEFPVTLMGQFHRLDKLSNYDLAIFWNENCGEMEADRIAHLHPEVSDFLMFDESTHQKLWLGDKEGNCLL